ncbi:MAG: ADP-ribosylation factor-like protein [Candidatus Helarchaeota archaeon]
MLSDQECEKLPIKCIFIGLDNSGKTSILTTLEDRFVQLENIQPTQRILRSKFYILGLPIIIWDMGGQSIYIKEYLSQPKHFENTNLLFYVIDIQDPDRFEQSLEYFLDILKIFIMLRLKPSIRILFHKCDPTIRNESYIHERTQFLQNLFQDLPEAMDITFHQTSIYDYEQLSRVFVRGILKILPKGEIINTALKEFMGETQLNAIILFDENILPIAENYIDERAKKICKICGPHFVSMAEKLRKYALYLPDTIEVEMQGWLFFKFIKYLSTRFYLVFFTDAYENFTKINYLLPKFTERIYNIIKFVL